MTLEEAYRSGYQAAKLMMPEIVKCKDCKYACICDTTKILPEMSVYAMCTLTEKAHKQDWFCGDGERKD